MTDPLLPKLQTWILAKDPQGTALADGNDFVVRFSVMGVPQELRIQYVPPKSWTLLYTAKVPDARERWFLESKGVWFPEHGDCKRVTLPPLDARYKVFASDEPFLRSVFSGKDLEKVLLQVGEEDHVKASLQNGTLKFALKVRFNPRFTNREAVLANWAEVVYVLGALCFKGVQLAVMMRP
jgi:hypothetical protein